MHILAFENKPTLHAGGQERSLLEVLKGLNEHNHDISLIYGEKGELIEETYNRFCYTIEQISSRVFRRTNILTIAKDFLKARSLLKTITPHLLYVNQYPDLPLPAVLSKWTGIPLICHLRLPAPHYLSRQYRWGLKQCTRLIAISEHTRTTYIEQGVDGNKIEVLHNAIDTEQFKPLESASPDSNERKILYLGRLCPPKGIEVLLQAATQLLDDGKPYRFEIIGQVRGAGVDASYQDELNLLAGSYRENGIHFIPHKANVLPDLQTADLVVVPSIWPEPFGRVIIEAMACETPVIASRVGGIPEILEPSFPEMLVPPNDPDQLALKIAEQVNWRQDRPDLGRRMREEVERRFALADYIPKLESIFENVLTGSDAS